MTPAGTSAQQPQLPLTALLSQALVAFTIEFDNAAEQQIQHRTARHGGAPRGVWLVSMAMWLNCMRYVGTDPITVGDVARLARCRTNLDGMRRWGFVTLTPDPADERRRPPDDALLIASTARGQLAQDVWRPLTATIEARWRDRFGPAAISELTTSLAGLAGQLGDWLPDCLPILGYGLCSLGRGPGDDRYLADQRPNNQHPSDRHPNNQHPGDRHPSDEQACDASPPLALPWLLARVLLALAIDYERESRVSLAVAANLLRVIDDLGTRVRDLPALSGVSKEAIAIAAGFAGKRGLLVIEAADGDGDGEVKVKVARLTSQGHAAQRKHEALLASIEDRWRARFGGETIGGLRAALEQLAGPGGSQSPLFAGLQPDPQGWRAAVRPPSTLPHYPMVLHRGGYPDGS